MNKFKRISNTIIGIVCSIYVCLLVTSIIMYSVKHKEMGMEIIEETLIYDLDEQNHKISTTSNNYSNFLNSTLKSVCDSTKDYRETIIADRLAFLGLESISFVHNDSVECYGDEVRYADYSILKNNMLVSINNTYYFTIVVKYGDYLLVGFEDVLVHEDYRECILEATYQDKGITLLVDENKNVISSSMNYTSYFDINSFIYHVDDNPLEFISSTNNYKYYAATVDSIFEGYKLVSIVEKDCFSSIANSFSSLTSLDIFFYHIASFITMISVLIILNIIYHRQNVKFLRLQTEYLGKMFNYFDECFIVYNSNTKAIEFVSDNIDNVLGLSKSQIMNFEPLYTIEGKDIFQEIANLLITSEAPMSTLELTYFNKNKNKNSIAKIKCKDVYYNEHSAYGIIISDISDEIEQKHLLSSRLSKAEESSSQMEQFLSKVSHELRTPLNGVIGMNRIAIGHLESGNIEATSEALITVENSGRYLLSLINNLLDLSKMQHGQMQVTKGIFSLTKLIDEIYDVVKTQLKLKNLTFVLNSDIEETYINTDKVKLSQIITNLLSNAIKYNNVNGKIELTMTKEELVDSNVKISITIRDTGIGMSSDFITKLFTPFAQENRANQFASTGLGLSIAKSLVSLLNGEITVESQLNHGSTFRLEFVFEEVKSVERDVVPNEEIDLSGIRVILAEDNPINALICESHLSKIGIKPVIVKDGKECVDRFLKSKEFEFDLILMDIQMPNMNGYEATRVIRNSVREDHDILILAMTADSFKEDVEKAFLNKMDGHISKPIVIEDMNNTIYSALRKRGKIK